MLTRREILQQAGKTATVLTTTAPWWLVRRAHAARAGEARRLESGRAGAAGRQDHAGAVLRLRQAGGDQGERDRLSDHRRSPARSQAGGGARGREPAGYHPAGWRVRAALPLARPPPGGDRPGQQDAEGAGGTLSGLPAGRHASGQGLCGAAVHQPLAAGHPHGSPRGGQGRVPRRRGTSSSRSARSCRSRPSSPALACVWVCRPIPTTTS